MVIGYLLSCTAAIVGPLSNYCSFSSYLSVNFTNLLRNILVWFSPVHLCLLLSTYLSAMWYLSGSVTQISLMLGPRDHQSSESEGNKEIVGFRIKMNLKILKTLGGVAQTSLSNKDFLMLYTYGQIYAKKNGFDRGISVNMMF